MSRFVSPELAAILEAEPLLNNEQLLGFHVRSRDTNWEQHVMPLRPRGPAIYLQRDYQLMSNVRLPCNEDNKREVLVCHDMMGNYLEDKHFHSSKKYDDYRFYHWSAIDYFCYFSHKYITIPPCGWINAAHKHGVRVLGTYIVEDTIGSRLLHQVLSSRKSIEDTVEAMTRLCKHFHFDGWLVNVECDVQPEYMELLYYFVDHLRHITSHELKHGTVFWYDSVIDTGKVQWQDELNEKNIRFLQQSDVMLLNYSWKDSSFDMSQHMCFEKNIERSRIFFGIDVFGRNQKARFQTKRTLQRIVERSFSTGIFAPAWTYETLQHYGYNIKEPLGLDIVNDAFLQRNEKWWSSLWDLFATHPYNDLPFYTDFCLGSGKNLYRFGIATDTEEHGPFFNLSCQSLQPSVALHGCAEHNYDDGFNGGSCLHITRYDIPFRLFAFDIYLPENQGLVIGYAFKLKQEDGEIDCVLRFCDAATKSNINNSRDCYLFCGNYYNKKILQRGRCYVSPLEHEFIHGNLTSHHLPKNMSLSAPTSEWSVRYYAVVFDTAVCLRDFGVLYRHSSHPDTSDNGMQQHKDAMLGAVYVNGIDMLQYSFKDKYSNYAFLPVQQDELFNSMTS